MAVFRFDASKILSGLERSETKAQIAIRMFATEGAKTFENYAKLNRPWTDRTGRARQSLVGWVETMADRTRIHIGHGVKYGIYLELAHEKKYAILQPTIHAKGKEVLESYRKLERYLQP